jgi:leucyl/phenylalanyl-tRNA---protein transferase
LYGVALDKVFFGESMFSTAPNGSKAAFIHLVAHLRKRNFQLIDCQMTTQHLLRFGAREIPGRQFSDLLQKYILTTTPDGTWTNDTQNTD